MGLSGEKARHRDADLLLGVAGSDALRRSIRGGPLHQAFEALLREACLPAGMQVASESTRVKFKPGRKLTVTYDVRLGAGVRARPSVAVWTLGTTSPRHAAASASPGEPSPGARRPFRRLEARDVTAGLQVLIAPCDPAFPRLAELTEAARPVLASAGADAALDYRPSIVRYRPGERHVLRLVPAHSGAPEFVLKLYPRGAAEQVARMTRAVATASRRAGGSFGVPDVWASGDSALICAAVPGRPLSWWLRHRPAAAGRCLAGAGAALRVVHEKGSTEPGGGASVDPAREVTTTGRAAEHISVLLPDVAARIAGLLARARAALGAVPAAGVGLVHGDFKCDHVLVSSSGLALIDVDRAGSNDPALDLGKFLADLHWWLPDWRLAGSRERSGALNVDAAQAAFLQGYGQVGEDLLRRARILEAVLVVRLAARRPRLDQPNWAALTGALVARAERLSEDWERS